MNKVTSFVSGTILFVGLVLITYTGCKPAASTANVDPAVLAKHQAEFVLTEQPANPLGITELMTQLAGDSPDPEKASSDPVEVALLGKLTPANKGVALFVDGEATFSMIDPSYEAPVAEPADDHPHEDGDDADHAHADTAASGTTGEHEEDCACAFCKSSKVSVPQAIVKFVDADNEVLPIGAQQLFNLNAEELVVVTGSAKLSVGQLHVTADKIYIRK